MNPTNYQIKSGDTLSGIALANNTTVQALQQANPSITNPNRITAGASLFIPQIKAPVPANTTLPAFPLNQQNTQQLNVPSPSPVVAQVQTPVNLADTFYQQSQVQESEIAKQGDNLSMKIANLIPELQGQNQALQEAERQVGVQALRQDLQGLNSQIMVKQQELNRDDAYLAQSLQNIEDKPIALEFITGQQASVQRNAQLARGIKIAEIGMLNARAMARQGDIALAQEAAKSAVEEKYAPIKDLLDTYKLQLEAIQPLLTKEEKKRAEQQDIRMKFAMQDLEQKKSDEAEIQKLLINASSQGAPQNVITNASKAKTPAEAAAALGLYAGNYRQAKLLDLQIKKAIGELAPKATTTGGGLAQGVTATGAPISTEAQNYVNLINKGTMTLDQALTKLGTSKEAVRIKNEIVSAISNQGGATTMTTQSIQTALNLVQEMKNKKDWKEFGYSAVFGGKKFTSYGDMSARAEQLNSLLAKDNLGLLTGPMSDRDIQFIKDMSGGINSQSGEIISEGYAKERIENIEKTITQRLKDLGVEGSTNQPTSDYWNRVKDSFNTINQGTGATTATDYLNSLNN